MEEVVITGMGCVTDLGNTPDELWNNLLAGKSGIGFIDRFDTEAYPVKFAGQVKEFDASPYYSERDRKRISRSIQYAVHSAETALKMAGIEDPKTAVDVKRAAVVVGSGMGGMEIFYDSSVNLATKGPKGVSPFFVPQAIANMVAGEIGIRTGWMGANWSPVSACATSNHSFITAADQIRLGRVDIALAGGTEEAVCPIGLAGFASMKALSTNNDAPEKASRPFDAGRNGFVLSEGAGILVLESRSHAEKRGAKILARLAGYGTSCDAYHMSAPREDGEGVNLAISLALKDAGIDIMQVGYVNTHGTSTPRGDVAECKAIFKAFNGKIDNVKINSTKSMTGHMLGAASGMEAVVVIKCLIDQKLHQTLNLENQDGEIPFDCCKGSAVEHKFEYALSNSFGFGGHNSVLVLGKA
ncbi:MAG: beta-ketoacyl-ACP synthase II [Fibromonadaceae bacterium]|jgi:3-oxoacyl-[acyl-carrier-protein] synthase II|nr:beta-ketoacyl-ACP synthase II [Fibromonadaceae bacterium]